MNPTILSFYLSGFGILGSIGLVGTTGMVLWHYRNSRFGSFRWRWRTWRLMQLSGIACLFFIAMAASYGILQEAWGWLYVLGACKTGAWWVRYAMTQRI